MRFPGGVHDARAFRSLLLAQQPNRFFTALEEIDVNEKATRRAKATLLKDTTSQREEYYRLPAYIDELRGANPGAHLKLNPDTGTLRSLFICPQISREAFRQAAILLQWTEHLQRVRCSSAFSLLSSLMQTITLFASHGNR